MLQVSNLTIRYQKIDFNEKTKLKQYKTKANNPIINIDTKHREHKFVVEDLSFKINDGEIFGLVGRSGCGKTTVAWTIMGMIEKMGGHASGKILLDDEVIFNDEYIDIKKHWWKNIAIVPQASMSAFNPCLKMKDAYKETLVAAGLKDIDMDKKCEEMMDIVCLKKEVLSLYPHQMSGGMKQRAAIGIALLLSPKLLILDEATTGLDVLVEAEILKTIKDIQKDTGMSLLIISHDKRLTSALCHRIHNLSEV